MKQVMYLAVPDLERWQHYKDRRPPWMKLHIEIFDNYDFGNLPDECKYHLLGIWLLATQIDNKIPSDNKWIERKIGANSTVDIEMLLALGHLEIHPDSELLARDKQNALAETEAEAETETETEKKTSGKKHTFTEDDAKAASWMFACIKALNPNHRQPNLDSWANDVRLMRERDKRSLEQIRSTFTWANNHSFWQQNILSPSKLREKFDNLLVQIGGSARQQPDNFSETDYNQGACDGGLSQL